jgi:hypothetical protein
MQNGSRGFRFFIQLRWNLNDYDNSILTIAYIHGNFKTETHFSSSWLGPHGHSPLSLVNHFRAFMELYASAVYELYYT